MDGLARFGIGKSRFTLLVMVGLLLIGHQHRAPSAPVNMGKFRVTSGEGAGATGGGVGRGSGSKE